MYIFLKKNHKFKGIHRLLEGFTINPSYELVLINNIEDTRKYKKKDKAIYGGFSPGEVAKDKNFKIKYYVFCSPYGQLDLSSPDFISQEMAILLDVHYHINDGKITGIISGSNSLGHNKFVTVMPHIRLGIEENLQWNDSRDSYGFLGNNFRKHRNVTNQISAISRLSPKEKIVVSDKSPYEYHAKLFDCEFISPQLKTDKDYYKEIATHILGFQCSWSEAFNYIAWEYAFMGVPCVVSPAIYWYPISELIVWNVDDPNQILETAQEALNDPSFYAWASQHLKEWAVDYNKDNKLKLMEKLEELLKR